MAYVGNTAPASGCVFCQAPVAEDDVSNLILHRGHHCFVIMNLYPYNTGHLMVVPYDHVDDLAMLQPEALAEMAALSASFCTGLREVMGCDGMNLGMNLGSVAGAGIADHLHQHIVPRWKGDANFMPIIGGTKVLPELIPATYGKLRAEVARNKSDQSSAKAVLVDPDWSSLYLVDHRLPEFPLQSGEPAWKSVSSQLEPVASSMSLLGWAGAASTTEDEGATPVLAWQITPVPETKELTRHALTNIAGVLSGEDVSLVQATLSRFAPPSG
jgi:ATP adenylyltransferase